MDMEVELRVEVNVNITADVGIDSCLADAQEAGLVATPNDVMRCPEQVVTPRPKRQRLSLDTSPPASTPSEDLQVHVF